MASSISELLSDLSAWPPSEIIAVCFAVLYLLLAIRESIWCWFCAGISTAIYVYLYFDAKLYMESALNLFYFAMAIYGWSVWTSDTGGAKTIPVTTYTPKTHAIALGAIVILALGSGFLLTRYTDAAFPYVDSATTFAAIWSTFLIARKVLENWWYWFVIDMVSIVVYWSRGLELTSMLFVLYVILIPFGLIAWTRSWRNQEVAARV